MGFFPYYFNEQTEIPRFYVDTKVLFLPLQKPLFKFLIANGLIAKSWYITCVQFAYFAALPFPEIFNETCSYKALTFALKL